MLIIHQNPQDIEIIAENFYKLLDREDVLEVLKSNYSVVIMKHDHSAIKELIKKQNLHFIPPMTIFMHDPESTYLNNTQLIINKLEGFFEYKIICEIILECLSKKRINVNHIQDDYEFQRKATKNLSPLELLERQKRELQEVEKEAQMKEIAKQMELEKEQKEKEERKKIELNLQKKNSLERRTKEYLKENLLAEPIKDSNTCTISFRMPDGTLLERRFSKNWKIVEMYNFIGSLDNVLTEEETEFDLIIPFPMKVYNDMNQTFEQAGLFPNAMLVVREHN